MSDAVWVSTAPASATNLRPLRHDVGERSEEHLLTLTKKMKAGEPVREADLPSEIWAEQDAESGYDKLPNFFYAYGFWVLSGAAADVFRQFDLGQCALRPVAVLHKDRQTPISGNWVCIAVGNTKRAFVADQSPRTKDGWAGGRLPPFVVKDDDIAVSQAALEGPDIWVDPLLHRVFFLSGPLGAALKSSKLSDGFFLKKCLIV